MEEQKLHTIRKGAETQLFWAGKGGNYVRAAWEKKGNEGLIGSGKRRVEYPCVLPWNCCL